MVTLDPKERFCGCGGLGHLEGIVGNRAMRLRFLDMEPEEVFAAARAGDARASEFANLWHRALAAATATSVHMEGAGRFYIAGPNCDFVDLGLLNAYMQEMVKMTPLQGSFFEIVETSQDVALIGARSAAGRSRLPKHGRAAFRRSRPSRNCASRERRRRRAISPAPFGDRRSTPRHRPRNPPPCPPPTRSHDRRGPGRRSPDVVETTARCIAIASSTFTLVPAETVVGTMTRFASTYSGRTSRDEAEHPNALVVARLGRVGEGAPIGEVVGAADDGQLHSREPLPQQRPDALGEKAIGLDVGEVPERSDEQQPLARRAPARGRKRARSTPFSTTTLATPARASARPSST